MTLEQPKPVVWVGSSLRDMRELPAAIRRFFGVRSSPSSAVKRRLQPSRSKDSVAAYWSWWSKRGGTYRAVYAVRFKTAIYVLHVFQKKSKSGKATPQRDIETIKQRLMRAAELDQSERNRR